MNVETKKLALTIVYAGESREDVVPPQKRIEGEWHRLLAHFGIKPEDAAALGLFLSGNEISREQSFAEAGVPDGATLHIRPRQQQAG